MSLPSTDSALASLQTLINEEIPPARAMGFTVDHYHANTLSMSAPLEANLNHHGTAFGGSQFSLAAVCGWALTVLTLRERGLATTVVVKSVQCDYLRPVTEELHAIARFDSEQIDGLLADLKEKQSARLVASADIVQGRQLASRFRAVYSIKNPREADEQTPLR